MHTWSARTGSTRHASTFDRRDVLRAWCDALPAGADVALIEQLTNGTLADPAVVALRADEQGPARTLRRRATGRAIDTPSTGTRYSTHELLALESRLLRRASTPTAVVGVAEDPVVLAALAARPGLSPEQIEMVATLTTSGRAVDVVLAAAGTGKTFGLDAAGDAWQHSGHTVIGSRSRLGPRSSSRPLPGCPPTPSLASSPISTTPTTMA